MIQQSFNNIAKIYDFFFIQFFYSLAYSKILKNSKNYIKENSKILDVGCGTGNLLNKINKTNKNLELIGIDQSEEMIKIGRNKFQNIKFIFGNADNLPFKNNYFDIITIIDSFYYFKNKNKVISECQRTLKPNGILYIYTPSIDSLFLKFLINLTKTFPTEKNSEHLTFQILKNIIKNNGFNILLKQLKYFSITPLKYWSLILIKNEL